MTPATSCGGSSPLTRGKRSPGEAPRTRSRLIPAHAGKTQGGGDLVCHWWAHPRSRGENAEAFKARARQTGSSPLTRGKPRLGVHAAYGVGLIPAHAGKTLTHTAGGGRGWAHPRSRGENWKVRQRMRRTGGSSPLTRGKPPATTYEPAAPGLIPAHAGKTSTPTTRKRGRRAHPRSRGENAPMNSTCPPGLGSSPLTRGKLRRLSESRSGIGLIPAHAGKTCPGNRSTRTTRAHPRSRGENVVLENRHSMGEGSSPLTRGKPNSRTRCGSPAWLIPAHAGKTGCRGILRVPSRAHPRSRGENVAAELRLRVAKGSSPLTRGKLVKPPSLSALDRLIPAHAGKTTVPEIVVVTAGAHPRSRGENLSRRFAPQLILGSSPLTRGKQFTAKLKIVKIGLIPAHAGKTSRALAAGASPRAHPRSRGENTS